MYKKATFIALLTLFVSCQDSIQLNRNMMISSLSDSANTNADSSTSDPEDDCIFSDELSFEGKVSQIEEFANYSVDKNENTTSIILENQDTLEIQTKGCDYISVDFKWTLQNESHSLSDISFWIKKTKWLNHKLLSSSDVDIFTTNAKEKNYNSIVENNSLALSFTNHNYQEWYLKVVKNNDNSITLNTGYYYN